MAPGWKGCSWASSPNYGANLPPSLFEDVDSPRVQYLSQQVAERHCSSEGITDKLPADMERVIFGAHTYEDRLGSSRFRELLDLRARLFCALVAEVRDDGDRSALRWLEAQPASAVMGAGHARKPPNGLRGDERPGSQWREPDPSGASKRLMGENTSPATSPRRDHDLAGTS